MAQQGLRPPRGLAPVPIRERGPCDNQSYFNKWIESNPLFRDLFVGKLRLHPFSETWDNVYVPTMIYLVNFGKALKLGQRSPRVGDIQVVSMAEALAPALPESLFLPDNDCPEYFVACVIELMRYQDLDRLTEGTRESYHAFLAADSESCPYRVGIEAGTPAAAIRDLWGEGTVADWPENLNVGITPRRAMRVLYHLADRAQRAFQRSGLNVIANVLVSIAKRGVVSEAFIAKVVNGVRDDLNKTLILNADDIRIFHATFGIGVDDRNIRAIVNRWSGFLPAAALRLSLTLTQIAGSGLTAYLIIGKAMCRYRDFPWAEVRLLFPDEWRNYFLAVGAVGDNVYYGFRKDLGPAKSTLFKSLAYVAKELLIKVGGMGSLRAYAGWVNRVPEQARVDMIIAEYEGMRAQAVGAERIAAVAEEVTRDLDAVYNQAQVMFYD